MVPNGLPASEPIRVIDADQVVTTGTQLSDDRSRGVRPRGAAQSVEAIGQLRGKLDTEPLLCLGRPSEERLGREG